MKVKIFLVISFCLYSFCTLSAQTDNKSITGDKTVYKVAKAIESFSPAKAGTRWTFQAARQDRNILSDKSRTGSTIFPLSNTTKKIHQSSRFGLMEFVE